MVLVLVLMIASPSAMELQFFKPLACACIRLHRWIAEFILLHLHLFFFCPFLALNASWFGFVQTVQSADTFFGGLPEEGARLDKRPGSQFRGADWRIRGLAVRAKWARWPGRSGSEVSPSYFRNRPGAVSGCSSSVSGHALP
jgi:hypothetical protein